MAEKNTVVIDDLLGALEDASFEVVHVGTRYRVTNPVGGRPVFVPGRLPKGAKLGPVVAGLKAIGFDYELAAQRREAQRQERLEKAREEGERLMAVAEAAAKARQEGTAVAVPRQSAAVRPTGLVARRTTEQYTEVVEVTPAMAEEWLIANRFYVEGATHAGACNRRYRVDLAREYAAAMLRNEWILTNQGIAFNIEGDLADGQHRLGAVVLAGLTKPDIQVPFNVTWNMAVEAADVVDTGLKRTTADALQMRGEKGSLTLAAVLRLIMLYDNVPYEAAAWKKARLTNEQMWRMLDREPGIRVAAMTGHGLHKIALASAAGAAYHLIRRAWPEDLVNEFYDRLRLGHELERGTALNALREVLVNQRLNRKYKRTPTEQMAMFMKAWNSHVTGKGRSQLAWRVDEPFPKILTPEETTAPVARSASG